MVKDVFLGFVYAEKLDQERKNKICQPDVSTESIDILQDRKIFLLFTGWVLQLFSQRCTEEN